VVVPQADFLVVILFLCGGWLVFYVNTITRNATTVASPALTGYALVAAAVFAIIVVLVVSHNLRVYPKRFAEWNRSFICQRCGTLFEPFKTVLRPPRSAALARPWGYILKRFLRILAGDDCVVQPNFLFFVLANAG